MILKTDFRASDASNLVDYIQRDRSQDRVRNVDLQNPAGRELSDTERDQFVEKSRHYDFQRHMIVSPDPDGQYTPQEVSDRTREFMNQEIGQQPSAEYVYAVHRDTEFPHAHVAITGRKPELEMDRAEIERLRERASNIYNEPERAREATPTGEAGAARGSTQGIPADTRDELHERELGMEEHPEKEVLRDTERVEEKTPTNPPSERERDEQRSEPVQAEPEDDRDREPESEQEPEPELERDRDWMMGG